MKRLTARRQAHLEQRRKKKIKRRQTLKNRASERQAEPSKPGLPRYIKRKHELFGTTYWRGDRFVLEGYKG